MKFCYFIVATIVLAECFAFSVSALQSEHKEAAQGFVAPRFSDPGGHNSSRYVAQPGGSPYYLRPAFISLNSSQVTSSSSNPGSHNSPSQ